MGLIDHLPTSPLPLSLYVLADLTVRKRPGTSNRIEIHFAVFNHLYL